MLGYESPEELIENVTDIDSQLYVDPEHCVEFKRLLETHGIARGFETQFFRRDQRAIWVSLNVRAMHGENGESFHFEGTAEDITARRQAEEELRRLNTELEQRVVERTAQLEAINRELEAFSYSVSHDLRASLRAIDGFSQAFQEDYADKVDDQGKHYLQRIRASVQGMGQLIEVWS
jgi:PAS domain S-box-containing protein